MDEIDNFLEEQKAKVANDKAVMENNPPYMEIKVCTVLTTKSSGLSFQLGTEYEQKKQKLQQELRLDYRLYVAQKNNQNAGEPCTQPQSLSLPIAERRSAKEKLRDERNKEYNLFLQGQAGQIKRQPSLINTQAPGAVGFASPPSPLHIPLAHSDFQSNTKDTGTLTEADKTGAGARGLLARERRRWELHRPEDSLEHLERGPKKYRSRRAEYIPKEELSTEEDEVEFVQRRRPRRSIEPEYRAKAERRLNRHDSLQMANASKTTERSRSAANKYHAQFSTGLIIGAAEGEAATQLRKERYRKELQDQIAEQKQNKIMEKELELRVAATGAIDPEKKPDRIKHFGAVNRDYGGRKWEVPYRPGIGLDALGTNPSQRPGEENPSWGREERGPPEKPRIAFPSPPLDYNAALSQLQGRGGLMEGARVPGAAPINEDLHRSLSNTLGDIAVPRIAGIPPPLPPTLNNTHRTPYDEAYYYYGARNPLDPNLPYYGPPGGVHPLVFPNLPPRVGLPSGRSESTNQHGAAPPYLAGGILPLERPKQSKQNAISYQESLRQQIFEGEERKRREREDKERYEAKMEAERKAYDPWGKSGGGAPLKDHSGNLISDLNQMHRSNEEAYVNPESREQRRARGSMVKSLSSPRVDHGLPSDQHKNVVSFAQTSQFARGNIFPDQPTPQHLHEQDSYKDFLKQQIEEKRRKEAEEKERIRMEEEKEEKRMIEQRLRIKEEYEEEQERKKRKEIEQSAKNEELMRQAEERRREVERKMKAEEERQSETFRLQFEKERRAQEVSHGREPSPPIPTLQKKLSKLQTPRAPSAASRLSSRTFSDRSMSAPHSPPVPARKNQLRAAEDEKGVISGLAVLSEELRREHRRLEAQRGQEDREEGGTPLPSRSRGRAHGEIFDMARARAAQSLARRPHSAQINVQNIREFNQLKYRDTASRKEVRDVYPDPPGDEYSLDIQQQALLREQQRRIRSMRQREDEAGYYCMSPVDQHPHPYSELDTPDGPRRHEGQPDAQSLLSVTSLNVDGVRERNQHRNRRLDALNDHTWTSGGLSGDEQEDFSMRSSPYTPDRPVSVVTVATEPWLRPGTSDAVKWLGGRERPSSRDTLNDWEGPSTYHG
ncbi:centrosome and spindle pole-associated protein 1 [Aplochiton taeniatus]